MRQRLMAEKRRQEEALKNDTTHAIWELKFHVKVPQLAVRGIEMIRLRGTLVSGVKEIDDDIKNRLISTYCSINEMIELYRQDIPVRVTNVADTKTIYEHITTHLVAWRDQLKRGVNLGRAPIGDLILMDRFATTVYAYAKYRFLEQGDELDSLLARHITGIMGVSMNNFFDTKAIARMKMKEVGENATIDEHGNTVINGNDTVIPARESYSEFFEERLINGSWRGKR